MQVLWLWHAGYYILYHIASYIRKNWIMGFITILRYFIKDAQPLNKCSFLQEKKIKSPYDGTSVWRNKKQIHHSKRLFFLLNKTKIIRWAIVRTKWRSYWFCEQMILLRLAVKLKQLAIRYATIFVHKTLCTVYDQC